MAIIRDRPSKNPLEKFFIDSDVDNMMYVRQIKDSLVSIVFICS